MRVRLFLLALALAQGACTSASEEPIESGDDEVKVDTRSPEARRQYDANVAFASSYVAQCTRPTSGRPRVLVTGFGRFMAITNNATGRIVSALVPSAPYPETAPAPAGQVDDPAPQLSVASATIELPGVGEVDACAMILPVTWDLAAILIAKEAEAFDPQIIVMNGVAGPRQPLWIELGATNRAKPLDDGSGQMRPAVGEGESHTAIIEGAPMKRANLLSWNQVHAAAEEAVRRHANDIENGLRFGDLLPGAKIAGFPRASNTYLCNNVTYVTGHLLDNPGTEVRLLRASPAERGKQNHVPIQITRDLKKVPRVFVHWPSDLVEAHHAAGADVLKAILVAQLSTTEKPTRGHNDLADQTLRGGDTF